MPRPVSIVPERRSYNQWAASQTLEDFAHRHTGQEARQGPAGNVVTSALSTSSSLVYEAIGATITLLYGLKASVAAIVAGCLLIVLTGLPIAIRSARRGIDIDLVTRGAGFGYLGSTITTLIYASFTFLLLAIEASIMAMALQTVTGLSIELAYVVSTFVVVPIALQGVRFVGRFQAWTQPLWLAMQVVPVVYVLWRIDDVAAAWAGFSGVYAPRTDVVSFGLALSVLLSLLPRIGEQAGYLRFLPAVEQIGAKRWWTSVMLGGAGWVVIGGLKMLLGGVLAAWAVNPAMAPDGAASASRLLGQAFAPIGGGMEGGLVLSLLFVIICQTRVNVTNAFAGAVAWSNLFSRLTQGYSSRNVWLLFNVGLATTLLLFGITRSFEVVLVLHASLAAGWIGTLAADLLISRALGLSPEATEFQRAFLYDVNPVGIGAMLLSLVASAVCQLGFLGEVAQAFAPLIGLLVAMAAAPAIAALTKGRYYLARRRAESEPAVQACVICEHRYERADMAHCPVYAGAICSLCCTLETRCHDACKQGSRATEQFTNIAERLLPRVLARYVHTTTGHFVGVAGAFTLANMLVLGLIGREYARVYPALSTHVWSILFAVFLVFFFMSGVGSWFIVLAHESRRAALDETRRHLAELEQEIVAHEATDAALQKAREVAENANAAKSRYLVSVSHEIRSPLNSIYGYAQLLERGSDLNPGEVGKVICRSSEHLSNLVDGLLDIAQVEAGVLRLSRDTIRLPAFVEQIANMFRPQAQAKGLTFRLETPKQLPEFVRGDQKRLRQVLINLISNAIKFTPTGSVTFRIGWRGEIATFEVIDTGIGIAPEDMDRIFGAFERGTSNSVAGQPGIGLGLAITSTLVHVMGGDLTVDSTLGVGTRFALRLMLSRPVTQPVQSHRADVITGYEGDRRKVLVVDDDAAQASVIENLLRPLGFVVTGARDGDTAIALAAATRPDIVFMDISMPGKTGWETAGLLRAAHGSALRIVMVSADAHQFRRGGDGHDPHDMFLTKPVELDSLLDALSWQLDLTWTVADGSPRPPAPAAAVELHLPAAALPFVPEIDSLARIGNVRAIQNRLSELEDAVPDAARFVAHLRTSLECFDFKGLREALRRGVVSVQ
ncbi:response regulator [Novosphingobium sp. 1Y9A]|uniref:histidine kinase n=1 Tax=Novosphingobium jiangmenense TaxID=2791981 RepID=A0ABS0HHK3_9SPHN|nr:response regulator [Novosphingobium jiangmenense]